MKIFDNKLDFTIINSPLFKEDSVREEIVSPVLKALGYSAFGNNMIVRSKALEHPYIYFGTKKEHVKIIPDYLLQVDGVNKLVIDAKAPSENIHRGKNIEQAYSYAIHREIQTSLYALCNGISFVVYDVNKTSPILDILVSEIEEKWDDVFKLLSPLALTKPYIFDYKPDLGLRIVKSGITIEHDLHFLGAWINSLAKLNDEYYTLTTSIDFETDCIASFDFHKDLINDFINQIPLENRDQVIRKIKNYPFEVHFTSKEKSFEINFSANLGTIVYENEDEAYLPLIVSEFIKEFAC